MTRSDDSSRLQGLLDISSHLMDAAEPDEVLQLILDRGTGLFECEGCSMALVDEVDDELVFFKVTGPAQVSEVRIKRDQGIAGWVMRQNRGAIVNDAASDDRFFGGVDKKSGYRTRSLLCAPIRQRGKTIGVIEAINTKRPAGFDDADLALLEAFGSLAGAALTRARMQEALRHAGEMYREDIQGRYQLVGGRSPAMHKALDLARRVARTQSTALLLGESGSGKEVMARAIHQWSPRADRPFVAVNCVALSANLLESELFGHEKGAFTGATTRKKGRFELADGGTIFLDEIGDLAPDLQTKLLRVLQEREFQRVGGSQDIRCDVRVVAATNRNLQEAMRDGGFREDLYYRLNVFTIQLPPLRARREDIPELAHHFCERFCTEVSRQPMGFANGAMERLVNYGWPGNVRELSNVIERAAVLAAGPDILPEDLAVEARASGDEGGASAARGGLELPPLDVPLSEAVKVFKRRRIEDALASVDGNQRKAAELLGLAQSNLSRMMKTLGMR